MAARPGNFLRQRFGQPVAIHRLDGIEMGDGLAHLVGLERSDQVQVNARKVAPQRWPFRHGLLHAVFAEDAMTGFKHRADAFGGHRLRNSDQGHRIGGSPRLARRPPHPGDDARMGLPDRFNDHLRLLSTHFPASGANPLTAKAE